MPQRRALAAVGLVIAALAVAAAGARLWTSGSAPTSNGGGGTGGTGFLIGVMEGDQFVGMFTVEAAVARVSDTTGFQLRVPAYVPAGFVLDGIAADPPTPGVSRPFQLASVGLVTPPEARFVGSFPRATGARGTILIQESSTRFGVGGSPEMVAGLGIAGAEVYYVNSGKGETYSLLTADRGFNVMIVGEVRPPREEVLAMLRSLIE